MRTVRAFLALALVATTALAAQQPHPQGRPMGQPHMGPGPEQGMSHGPEHDPLMGNLFPPELIMQNQEAISLTDEQRNFMIGEVQRTQSQVAGTQWRLQSAVERLGALVRVDHPDEAQALVQLDSVLSLEREMKRAQIGLLLRLKGRLTAEQQNLLRQQFRYEPPRAREEL